ncbi:MAG: hypothetical protein R2932_09910 [Caldilineaceae bacterium]
MTEVTVYQPSAITTTGPMHLAGQAANHAASQHIFDDYASRKAANTLKAQAFDLAVFSDYLGIAGANVSADDLQQKPEPWQGITWGLSKVSLNGCLRRGLQWARSTAAYQRSRCMPSLQQKPVLSAPRNMRLSGLSLATRAKKRNG